jgi:hypothetical protein
MESGGAAYIFGCLAAIAAAACGGVTNVGVTHIDDVLGDSGPRPLGAGGAKAGGASADASGSSSSGAAGGTPRLVECDDGTGRADCCSLDAAPGASCDVNVAACSLRCGPDGYFGGLYCDTNGTWASYLGLLPCDRTVPCNDGTDRADCCPSRVHVGASCDGNVLRCWRGCGNGVRSDFICDGVFWTAAQGSNACRADGG